VDYDSTIPSTIIPLDDFRLGRSCIQWWAANGLLPPTLHSVSPEPGRLHRWNEMDSQPESPKAVAGSRSNQISVRNRFSSYSPATKPLQEQHSWNASNRLSMTICDGCDRYGDWLRTRKDLSQFQDSDGNWLRSQRCYILFQKASFGSHAVRLQLSKHSLCFECRYLIVVKWHRPPMSGARSRWTCFN
jgi:hypothetical protein